MRFPCSFKRYVTTVPAGGKVLGADAVPTTAPTTSMDNVLFSRFANINGWPVHRVAILYTGPVGALNLPAQPYMWDDATQAWHAIGAAATLKPNVVTFVDVVALLDLPHASSAEGGVLEGPPNSGSIAQALVISSGGADPGGTYTFAMGPDLTTFP